MKKSHTKAYNELVKLGVPVYIRDDMDGRFQISAEEPDSYKWADYYEGDRNEGWIFGVNPIIDNVLRKYDLFCEWINPGELGVYLA
tara:strand:- start:597 stop:854 length:258 start_codon:yes stop_codon:yes gene_type:complete